MPTERPFWIWPIDRWHLLVTVLLGLAILLVVIGSPEQDDQQVAVVPTMRATPVPAAAEVAPTWVQPQPDQAIDSPRPILEGRATPNSVVRIYDGDSKLGETVADVGGSWRFQPSNPLAPGEHRLLLVGLDEDGNEVFPSPPLVVVIPEGVGEPATATTLPVDVTSPATSVEEGTAAMAEEPLETALPSPEAGVAAPSATPTPASAAIVTPISGVPASPATEEVAAAASPTPTPPGIVALPPTAELEMAISSPEAVQAAVSATPTPAPPDMVTPAPGVPTSTVPSMQLTATPVAEPGITAVPREVPVPALPSLARVPSGLLRNSRPPLRGTAPPGAVITIYDGEVLLGETMADAEGRWYFVPDAALAAGQHRLELQTLNSEGALANFASFDITIEDEADAVEPPTLEVISADGEPTGATVLQGCAPPGQLIHLFYGNRVLNVLRARRDGSWRWELPRGLPGGLYEFRVAIRDNDGQLLSESQTAAVSISLRQYTRKADARCGHP